MELGTNWKGGGGGGKRITPFKFELLRLYLNESCLYSSIFGSKLEFRVSNKGGDETEHALDPFKMNGMKRTHLMNLKEA